MNRAGRALLLWVARGLTAATAARAAEPGKVEVGIRKLTSYTGPGS